MNINDELYSEERLICVVGELGQRDIHSIVEGTVASVRTFAGEAPQSDDITILLLEYHGPSRGIVEKIDSPKMY